MGEIVAAKISGIEVSADGIRISLLGHGRWTPDRIRLTAEELLGELEEYEQERHQREMLHLEELAKKIKRQKEEEK